jgi:hypothetical protein
VRLPIEAVTASVDWRNAYGRHSMEFADAELCFLADGLRGAPPTPRGAVGLVAADAEQAAELLADLVENHRHYRETACQFARRWSAWHNADRVVAELLARRQAIPLPSASPIDPGVRRAGA